MTLLSLCLLWWWGWGWCDDDEDRRDRGGARETIWDYRDSWLSTTRGLTTQFTQLDTSKEHTSTSHQHCPCHVILNYWAKARQFAPLKDWPGHILLVTVLFGIYIFMMLYDVKWHNYKTTWWKSVSPLLISFCLIYFYLHWKVFFIHITLHYMNISVTKKTHFEPCFLQNIFL